MGTTYEKAGADITSIVAQIMEKHHGELSGEGVRVDVLVARNFKTSPVKVNGYPCAAKVRIVSLKDRALKHGDAEIVIDDHQYGQLSERSRKALIDHELTHLQLKRKKKTGAVVQDDQGRPKLKMKLHDWQLGGFESIAKRYKEDALEVQAATKLQDDYGQLIFAFAESVAA